MLRAIRCNAMDVARRHSGAGLGLVVAVTAALALPAATAAGAARPRCAAPQWLAYVLPDGSVRNPKSTPRAPKGARLRCWPPRRYVATVTYELVASKQYQSSSEVGGTVFSVSQRQDDHVTYVFHLDYRLLGTRHLRDGYARYARRGGYADWQIAGSEHYFSSYENPIRRYDCTWGGQGRLPLAAADLSLDAVDGSYALTATARPLTLPQSCTAENPDRTFAPREYPAPPAEASGRLSRKWLYSKMSGSWRRSNGTNGFWRVSWRVTAK